MSALIGLLGTLWRRRGVVLGISVLVMALAGLAIGLLSPSYRATAEILLTPPSSSTSSDTPSIGPDRPRTSLASEVEVITSRRVLRAVVRADGLMNDPAFGGTKETEATGLHRVLRLLGLRKHDAAPITPETRLIRAITALRNRLTVRPRGQSHVLAISVEAATPERAAQLANSVTERYLALRRHGDETDALKATRALRAQVTELRQSLEDAERAVTAFRRDAGLLPETANEAGDRIATLRTRLQNARERQDTLEARLARTENTLAAAGPLAAADLLAVPAEQDSAPQSETGRTADLRDMRREAAALRRKHAELDATYGPRHPKMQALQAELGRLRQDITGEVGQAVVRLRDALETQRARVQKLNGELTAARGLAAARASKRVRLNELERRAAAERQIYETRLAQLKRQRIGAGEVRPRARVISTADPPMAPASPNVPLLLALAALAAAPCGLGAALLAEHLDRGITNRAEVEALTGHAALSRVPDAPADRGGTPADHVLDAPRGRFADAVQRLATGIRFADPETPFTSVLVTSPDTGDGKSTLALALARSFAQRGERVLLLEADLRKPRLRATLRQTHVQGLSDVLSGQAAVADTLNLDPRSPVQTLHAGQPNAAPGPLLQGQGFADLLTALSDAYDRIIIDAPPVLFVSETAQIAPLADRVIMAVRHGRTRPETLMRGLADLGRAQVAIAGLVLTRVDRRAASRDADGDHVADHANARAYYGG